jgi:hypothetical protein
MLNISKQITYINALTLVESTLYKFTLSDLPSWDVSY